MLLANPTTSTDSRDTTGAALSRVSPALKGTSSAGLPHELAAWPTIDEAATRLETSTKTIRRRIDAGDWVIELRKRPVLGRVAETVCNPRDIEKLMPTAFVVPTAQPSPQREERNIQPGVIELFAAIATQLKPQPETKRWLTIEEAAQYSGLSSRLLKREARAGRLGAIRDPAWKIDRDSLDDWIPPAEQALTLSAAHGIDSDARDLARGRAMLRELHAPE